MARMMGVLLAGLAVLGGQTNPATVTDEPSAAVAAAKRPLQRRESHERMYHDVTGSLEFLDARFSDRLVHGQTTYYGEYTCAQGLAGSVVVVNLLGAT